MKKFLLSLSVAMLSVVGAWAQDFEPVGGTSDAEGAAVRRITLALSGDWLNGTNVETVTTQLIDFVMGYEDDAFNAGKAFTEVTIKSADPAHPVTVNQSLVQQLVTGKNIAGAWYNGDNKIKRLDLSGVAVTHYVGHAGSASENVDATLYASDSSCPIEYLAMPLFEERDDQTYTIPPYTIAWMNSLVELDIPKNTKVIEAAGFADVQKLAYFHLNPGLEFIGNSAFWAQYAMPFPEQGIVGMETLDVPSSVKYIGPAAFRFRNFTDLYFHSAQAPICPVGKSVVEPSDEEYPFIIDGNYMGFGGQRTTEGDGHDDHEHGYANRANYKNGDYWFTMVHFPSSTDVPNLDVSSYKDETRVYNKVYGTINTSPSWAGYAENYLEVAKPGQEQDYIARGKNWYFSDSRDFVGQETEVFTYGKLSTMLAETGNDQIPEESRGKGAVTSGYEDTYRGLNYIWPSQSQYYRAYITVAKGLNWDGVTKYRPELTDEQIALMVKDNLTIKQNGQWVTVGQNVTYDEAMANAYNATLPGAWSTETIITPAEYYSVEDIYNHNLELGNENVVKIGDALYYTQQEIDDHNANFEGAKHEGDVKEEGHGIIYYTYTEFCEYCNTHDMAYWPAQNDEAAFNNKIEQVKGGMDWSWGVFPVNPVKEPAAPTTYYNADDARAYNFEHCSEFGIEPWEAPKVKSTVETMEQANAYNAATVNDPGLWTSETVKTDAVYCTQEDADAHNMTLDGHREAGYTESNTVNPAVKDLLSMQAFQSTRRCVFADNAGGGDDYDPKMTTQGWWTICVPFDLTKAQIDKYFGVGTHLCKFNDVKRKIDGLAANERPYVKFYFTDDQYVGKNADDVVLEAHTPYMIFPMGNGGTDAVQTVPSIPMTEYYKKTGNPVPTVVVADDDAEYRFIGNYDTKLPVVDAEGNVSITDVVIPQYSYFYAKKKTETKYKFWFIQSNNMKWAANKCIIQSTSADRGFSDNDTFFTKEAESKNGVAKQITILGDEVDEDATAIDVIIVAGDGENSEVIYNLNGQMLNVAPQHGVYIKNGKKYIAK